jgi:Ca2+-binding EF-hand superfamily protein
LPATTSPAAQIRRFVQTHLGLYDRDSSGALSYEEMEQALRHLLPARSKEDLMAFIEYCDVDRNGEISVAEFQRRMLEAVQV